MDGVNQGHLVKALEVLFPASKTHLNARKHTNLKYPNGAYLEVDFWIPNIKLGFEFQDDYHYITTWYVQKSKENIKSKDYIKRFILHQKAVCLIDVPCWWDGIVESLAATIAFHRPDLQLETSLSPPIPLFPPLGFFPVPDIPGVGELMLASFPMELKILEVTRNLWWIGEKFDGIRCCWNPVEESLYTRGGRVLTLIHGVANDFPSLYVDGEVWFGRGQYTSTYTLLKGIVDNVYWHSLRMMAFDDASLHAQSRPFEERYGNLLNVIPLFHSFIITVMRVLCSSNGHASTMIDGVLEDGGEGVILRRVGSLYEHGRTSSLIKLKTSFGDKEGIVVGILQNRSVRLKISNGQIFDVPEECVLVQVRVGEIVSFSFESHSRRELPINPKIYRVRTDLVWEDVLYNSAKERTFLNDPSQVADYKAKPMGHWTKKAMRAFMEKFAKHKKMDPLLPETWYRLQFARIHEFKGGKAILLKFKGYVNAVRTLFPELKFDNSAFIQSSWSDIRNRRKFFEEYARKNFFDPLKPRNWYKQSKLKIRTTKGAYGVISYHKYNVSRALLDLFPNIGLDKNKLQATTAWHDASNRRDFFVSYARENHFDPLVAHNWYSQYSKLTSIKGVFSVIHHHGYSVSKALISLFPDVKFDRSKFQSKVWKNKYFVTWNSAAERRKFFESYALTHNFDPLVPENWYSEPREKILSSTGAHRVLHHHNRSLAQALSDLFPEIVIEKSKFLYQISWKKEDRRRKFFEDYAKDHGFDPLISSHWYAHPAEDLLAHKALPNIIHYHNKSIISALIDLFPEAGFDRASLKTWRFQRVYNRWISAEKRRKFFETFAQDNGFDALRAEGWYSQLRESIMETKGAAAVITHHRHSLSQALLDLFPNIGLQANKFSWVTSSWSGKPSRREFFVKYAEANGFDPFEPDQWYLQSRESIMAVKGASRVMHYHSNSVAEALIDLFPEIGLKRSKLPSRNATQAKVPIKIEQIQEQTLEGLDKLNSTNTRPKTTSWGDESKRRHFLEKYAEENGFDPLIPENWYSQQHLDKLINTRGVRRVLYYHKNRVSDAIYDLFPDIGLDKTRLRANCVIYPPMFQ